MLTQERLRELLSYDPATGDFHWLVSRGGEQAGSIAGVTRKGLYGGYKIIGIDYVRWYAHRLAWFYMTGKWPENEIDHISGDPSDNRWENLREATHLQNMFNKGAERGNASGFKGVWLEKQCGHYRSAVRYKGKTYHCGCFSSPQEAHKARSEKAKELHGEFARSE